MRAHFENPGSERNETMGFKRGRVTIALDDQVIPPHKSTFDSFLSVRLHPTATLSVHQNNDPGAGTWPLPLCPKGTVTASSPAGDESNHLALMVGHHDSFNKAERTVTMNTRLGTEL